jgi:3-hydroxybutyryl-CoA dehydrogenase
MTVAGNGVRRVTIVGAGRMGVGIAESLVIADLEVTFVESTPELCEASRERLIARMRAHAAAGLIPDDAAGRSVGVHTSRGIAEAIDGADLIIEAVTEDIAIKRDVLSACDAGAAPGTIIASNTSSLAIDELVQFVDRGERFLGMHWFNPPEWTPGVEVIPSAQTEPEIVQRVIALLHAIGKRPSTVSSTVGFVANRLQMALFCEAMRCVEEEVASPRQIDEVVRSCFGFRLPFFGPFQIADMAGLDVYEAVLSQHEQAFGERFKVPEKVRELVREGRRGTVAGGGFYDYDGRASEGLLVERDRRYAALAELLLDWPALDFDGGEGSS